MAFPRLLIKVLVRIDPSLWYLLDLRRPSGLSWVPAILLMALLIIATVACIAADNIVAAMVFATLALALLIVKRWQAVTPPS
jgi:hypothetical protein